MSKIFITFLLKTTIELIYLSSLTLYINAFQPLGRDSKVGRRLICVGCRRL